MDYGGSKMMQLYCVKHKLIKRIGEPIFLFYDKYHNEYDLGTIREIKGLGENVQRTFTCTEISKLKQYRFTIGMTMGTEWEIVKAEDVK